MNVSFHRCKALGIECSTNIQLENQLTFYTVLIPPCTAGDRFIANIRN